MDKLNQYRTGGLIFILLYILFTCIFAIKLFQGFMNDAELLEVFQIVFPYLLLRYGCKMTLRHFSYKIDEEKAKHIR